MNNSSGVMLRMQRWNGEQLHALYQRGAIHEAWLTGPYFYDVRAHLSRYEAPDGPVYLTGYAPIPRFPATRTAPLPDGWVIGAPYKEDLS
jgi:hypothetical protein